MVQHVPRAKQGRMKRARARQPRERGSMNKTETAYSQRLEAMRLAGEIQNWAFEAMKIRLADNTFYTPDFMVITADWQIEFHEVKAITKQGRWLVEDDAAVKFKVAAEMHWWAGFLMAGRTAGGGWEFRKYGGDR